MYCVQFVLFLFFFINVFCKLELILKTFTVCLLLMVVNSTLKTVVINKLLTHSHYFMAKNFKTIAISTKSQVSAV